MVPVVPVQPRRLDDDPRAAGPEGVERLPSLTARELEDHLRPMARPS